jgi:hypothetical protein
VIRRHCQLQLSQSCLVRAGLRAARLRLRKIRGRQAPEVPVSRLLALSMESHSFLWRTGRVGLVILKEIDCMTSTMQAVRMNACWLKIPFREQHQ